MTDIWRVFVFKGSLSRGGYKSYCQVISDLQNDMCLSVFYIIVFANNEGKLILENFICIARINI